MHISEFSIQSLFKINHLLPYRSSAFDGDADAHSADGDDDY